MIPQIEPVRFVTLPDGSLLASAFPERIGVTEELLDSACEAGALGMEVDGDVLLITARNGAALYERRQRFWIGPDEPAWEYSRVALEMHPAWQREG